MRKLIVAATSLAVFGVGWCLGQTMKPMAGGSTWKGIETPEREMYALGFKHGYVRGMNDAGSFAVMKYDDKKVLASLKPAEKKQWEAAIKEMKNAAPIISDNSSLVLTAALSTFYNDEQNSTICWDKAMMLSAASVAGNKPTEQELDAARKEGAESGCT